MPPLALFSNTWVFIRGALQFLAIDGIVHHLPVLGYFVKVVEVVVRRKLPID